jgi:hypothetical protein
MAHPLIEPSAAVVLIFAIKLGVLVTMWKSRAALRRFLKAHPCIRDDRNLTAFKQLARRNMRISLLLLGPLVLDVACIIAVVRAYGLAGLGMVLLVNIPVFWLSRWVGALEAQARSLSCEDAELQAEYTRVGKSWEKKAFSGFLAPVRGWRIFLRWSV